MGQKLNQSKNTGVEVENGMGESIVCLSDGLSIVNCFKTIKKMVGIKFLPSPIYFEQTKVNYKKKKKIFRVIKTKIMPKTTTGQCTQHVGAKKPINQLFIIVYYYPIILMEKKTTNNNQLVSIGILFNRIIIIITIFNKHIYQ